MTAPGSPPPAASPGRSAGTRSRRRRTSASQLLLVDAILVVLTGLAVAGRLSTPLVWTVVLAWTTVGALALIVLVRVRTRLRRFATALATASTGAVAGQALAPPSVAAVIDELERAGFSLAGVVDTAIAGRPDFRSWVLVEPSGETWIEVGDAGRAIAVFLSGTTGGRQVEAAWPAGMSIDEPELRAAPASASLQLTLADHRARVAEERRAERQLGTPPLDPARPDGWRVRTLDDYLAHDPIQRARTGGLRLRTDLRRRIEPSIRGWALSTAVGVACGAALAAFGR
jgi:hypothetical protein